MYPFSVFIIALAVFTATVFPVTVSADLSDMKVYSPIVEKGDLQFEFIGNVVIDDADAHHGFKHQEFEIEYGVKDFWATSITGQRFLFTLGFSNPRSLTGVMHGNSPENTSPLPGRR